MSDTLKLANNLQITEVKVADSLAERARTCSLVLAPPDSERVVRPAAEMRNPGDTSVVVASSIRPNSQIVKVRAGFSGVPAHTIFSGVVEDMDDLEDPYENLFNIELSSSPASQAHRSRISMVLTQTLPTSVSSIRRVYNHSGMGGDDNNMINVERPSGLDCLTSNGLLKAACKVVGVPLGRNDLPNHNLWGNYEVVRKNLMEIADDLCNPFNTFDFCHYFVRCDDINGLQIIKVDYTKGAGVHNPYVFSNVTKKSRSFTRYMPDNRIGDSNVVCRGAVMYGPQARDVSEGNNINKSGPPGAEAGGNATEGGAGQDPTSGGHGSKTVIRFAEHTYTGNNTDQPYNSATGEPPTGGNTENATINRVIFICSVTIPAGSALEQGLTSGGDADISNISGDLSSMRFTDIDTLIGGLASGAIINLSINAQYKASSKTRTTTKITDGELVEENETVYRYNTVRFPKHIYSGASNTEIVLTSDEAVTYYTHASSSIVRRPRSKITHSYSYSSFGVEVSTTENTYQFLANAWHLTDVQVQFADGSGTTGGEIAYYASKQAQQLQDRKTTYAAALADAQARGMDQAASDAYASAHVANLTTSQTITTGRARTEDVGVPIGRYMLINGISQTIQGHTFTGLLNGSLPANTTNISGGQSTYVSDRQPVANGNDPDSITKGAFELSVDYMDLSGLAMINALAVRQKELENSNPYWEIVRSSGPIDTTPAAGASVVVSGTAGTASLVTHTLTENEAVTNIELKRLVWL